MNVAADFLVHYGKNAALGSFTAPAPLAPGRGARVVVRGPRGLEVGIVLGPASPAVPRTGAILRLTAAEDEQLLERLRHRAEEIYSRAVGLSDRSPSPLAVLDVDLPLDGPPILQVLAEGDADLATFARALEADLGTAILLENLAQPPTDLPEPASAGGCGRPDCGREEGGGCTSCGTGGGCSSCGSGGHDLADYFAHLRSKMDTHRVPLA